MCDLVFVCLFEFLLCCVCLLACLDVVADSGVVVGVAVVSVVVVS